MADLMSLNVDDADVRAGLAKLRLRGKSMRPVFLKLKKPFREDVKAHQKDRRGPDGPWAPRAESSKRRDRNAKTQKNGKSVRKFKRRRKGRLLGKLPTSGVSFKSGGDSISGASKIPWASVHQYGGTVGRGSVIPARPFLFFSETFLDRAEHEIGDYLESGWRR